MFCDRLLDLLKDMLAFLCCLHVTSFGSCHQLPFEVTQWGTCCCVTGHPLYLAREMQGVQLNLDVGIDEGTSLDLTKYCWLGLL